VDVAVTKQTSIVSDHGK